MQKILRKYFERGISATYAASDTGYNIKTVCRYFDEWAEQIMELERNDFFEQSKLDRSQIISSFDNQFILAYKFLDEISEQIASAKKKGIEIPKHLMALQLDTLKFILIFSVTSSRFWWNHSKLKTILGKYHVPFYA